MKTIAELREIAKSLPHKEGVDKNNWDKVHDNLLLVLWHHVEFATEHDLPILITSIIRPRIPGVSKTDIHRDGRAYDASVVGWTKVLIEKCVSYINEKLSIGAISIRDGKEREVVYEDGVTAGKGAHLHMQVRA